MAINNAMDQMTTNVEHVKKRTSEMLHVPYDNSYRLSNNKTLWTRTDVRKRRGLFVVGGLWVWDVHTTRSDELVLNLIAFIQ